jgi:ASC-1-like (ASCH) protein
MRVLEFGLESRILDCVITRCKTIEGRLNRGKFSEYIIGDKIWLRRDYRDCNGALQDGTPHAALVEIIAIRKYKTFSEMMLAEDYKKVIPFAFNPAVAVNEYNKYYSLDDQQKYGVIAIEIEFIKQGH